MKIIHESMQSRRRWQDGVNLLLGLWLIAVPFLATQALLSTGAWIGYIFGAAIAGLSGRALYRPQLWEEWINVVIGLWLIAAPFALGFSGAGLLTLNDTVIGFFIAADALWATLPQPTKPARREHPHHA